MAETRAVCYNTAVKRITVCIILLFCVLFCAFILASCSTARTLEFADAEIIVKSTVTFEPVINIKPKKVEYTLESGNSAIAKTDGKKVVALKEGVVTLTVRSGKLSASVKLIVNDGAEYEDRYTYLGNYYTITYIDETGASVMTQDVGEGRAPGFPNLPLKPGYDVDGWYTDAKLTTKFNFENPLNSNITLYGKWVMQSARFKFETEGGKNLITGLLYPGVPYTVLNFPSTTDYGITVDGIKDGAFKDNTVIEEISIPASYTELPANAFYGCKSLSSVSFEEGSLLTEIGASCFRECEEITAVVLPDSVEKIGMGAFYGCKKLKEINFPAGLRVIEQYTFALTALEEADLSNVEGLFEGAFDGASKLASVGNTDKITAVYKYAFRGTKIFTDSRVPKTSQFNAGLHIIGDIVVGIDGAQLNTTVDASSIRLIADYAFSAASNELIIFMAGDPSGISICDYSPAAESKVFAAGIEIIFEDQYFQPARSVLSPWNRYLRLISRVLTEGKFTLFNRYNSIDGDTYWIYKYDKTSEEKDVDITKLSKPISGLKAGAFSQVPDMKTLRLGSALKNVENFAVNGNTALLAVFIDSAEPPVLDGAMSIAKGNGNYCMRIYTPAALTTKYKSKWSSLSGVILSSENLVDGLCIERAGNHAAVRQYHGAAETLIIPDTYTFNAGTASEITLPVTVIDSDAIVYNSSVKTLIIGKNIAYIYPQAVRNNSSLETVEFTSSAPAEEFSVEYFLSLCPVKKIIVPAGAVPAYNSVLPASLNALIEEKK